LFPIKRVVLFDSIDAKADRENAKLLHFLGLETTTRTMVAAAKMFICFMLL